MKYVIVGCGLAGATAVRTLRSADSEGEIHLYGKEPYPYYQRPRLWEYISGKVEDREDLYFRKAEWYEKKNIKLHLDHAVEQIDVKEHKLTLADGGTQTYDRLLLANGADAFLPPVKGTDNEGVFVLRSLDDAEAIIARAESSEHVMVVGGGLLGLETANALRMRGKRATVIEFIPHLLPRQIDEQGADILRNFLESLGLQIFTGASVEDITKNNDQLKVRVKDGDEFDTGMVIYSTGIRSRLKLGQEAGLEVNRGVLVDDHLQTSAVDVFAAGDVAEHNGIVYGIIPAAMEQAQFAAKNMVHERSTPYPGTVASTRLKAAGIEIASLGSVVDVEDDVLAMRKANTAQNTYRRFNIKNGKLIGAILIGEPDNVTPLRKIISSGKDISQYAEKMLEPGFDLVSFAKDF